MLLKTGVGELMKLPPRGGNVRVDVGWVLARRRWRFIVFVVVGEDGTCHGQPRWSGSHCRVQKWRRCRVDLEREAGFRVVLNNSGWLVR